MSFSSIFFQVDQVKPLKKDFEKVLYFLDIFITHEKTCRKKRISSDTKEISRKLKFCPDILNTTRNYQKNSHPIFL